MLMIYESYIKCKLTDATNHRHLTTNLQGFTRMWTTFLVKFKQLILWLEDFDTGQDHRGSDFQA